MKFQTTKGYRKAPVLVILEGEGFVSGYPGRIPAQDVAAEGIVVVSVSYRLNVFGKLTFKNNISIFSTGSVMFYNLLNSAIHFVIYNH